MQKSSASLLPTLSVRIDLDDEGRIGPGKIQLLEKIRETGSISAAGRAMDMSYKRAWDLVDEINRICRQAAVERQADVIDIQHCALRLFGASSLVTGGNRKAKAGQSSSSGVTSRAPIRSALARSSSTWSASRRADVSSRTRSGTSPDRTRSTASTGPWVSTRVANAGAGGSAQRLREFER